MFYLQFTTSHVRGPNKHMEEVALLEQGQKWKQKAYNGESRENFKYI